MCANCFARANSAPSAGAAGTYGFPPVERSKPKSITRLDIQALNWAQVKTLCREHGIDYQSGGSKGKDIAAKKDELWKRLQKAGEDARSVLEDVWNALKKMQSKDTMKRSTNCLQRSVDSNSNIWTFPEVHRGNDEGNCYGGRTDGRSVDARPTTRSTMQKDEREHTIVQDGAP